MDKILLLLFLWHLFNNYKNMYQFPAEVSGARGGHVCVVVAAGETRAAAHAAAGHGARRAQAHTGGPPHIQGAVRTSPVQHTHLPID